MPKKTTHPLVMELLLGKSVEEVIQEHFSGYMPSDYARTHLPRLIREIVEAKDESLRFAVRLEVDKVLREPVVKLKPYTCESNITLDYGTRVSDSPQPDCMILNDIVRRLYGINREDSKATHTQGFVRTTAVLYHCLKCGKTKCERYEQTLTANSFRFGYRILICQRCNEVVTSTLSKTWLGE
jgi:hypothetical protein